MPIFNLKVYRRTPPGPWGLASAYELTSPTLRGAVSQLSRRLCVKFKGSLTQDARTCWTLNEPPILAPVYLEIYPAGKSIAQRMKVLALDEFDAVKQLRLNTGKRIIHTCFSDSLQANTFACKDYTVFTYNENPLGEDDGT